MFFKNKFIDNTTVEKKVIELEIGPNLSHILELFINYNAGDPDAVKKAFGIDFSKIKDNIKIET